MNTLATVIGWIVLITSLFSLVVYAIVATLVKFNSLLPIWFCDTMKLHIEPEHSDYNGINYFIKCMRCSNYLIKEKEEDEWIEGYPCSNSHHRRHRHK